MKKSAFVVLCVFMLGCAQGRVDILDKNDKVIGYCSANFYLHWYGVQDSVDYTLYVCAKEHIDKGYRISDESILANDYTLPTAPGSGGWNKKLVKQQFSKKLITEKKLGYILAGIEYEYWQKMNKAEKQLSSNSITQEEYEKLVEQAKTEFEGT